MSLKRSLTKESTDFNKTIFQDFSRFYKRSQSLTEHERRHHTRPTERRFRSTSCDPSHCQFILERKEAERRRSRTSFVLQCNEPALITTESRQEEDDDENDKACATSPTGRFLKFSCEIGRGAFKTVFKGLDTETGVSVAWCEIQEKRWRKAETQRFHEEAEILKNLHHANIVRFYDYFIDPKNKLIVLITELMTSGTLRSYIKRFKKINTKLMKNWSRQILKGLNYLHGQNPPVIHRDLKCDNIFITGASGLVKIGDLGLATLKKRSFAKSVIGTPEFMAPEMYEEKYDESVDVYAFGMCLLEMATSEYPYKECASAAAIYRKVINGIKPESFKLVENQELRNIISGCIKPNTDERFGVQQLLKLEFFADDVAVKVDLLPGDQQPSEAPLIKFQLKVNESKKKRTVVTLGENEAIQFAFDTKNDKPEAIVSELASSKLIDDDDKMLVTRRITDLAKKELNRREEALKKKTEEEAAARLVAEQLAQQQQQQQQQLINENVSYETIQTAPVVQTTLPEQRGLNQMPPQQPATCSPAELPQLPPQLPAYPPGYWPQPGPVDPNFVQPMPPPPMFYMPQPGPGYYYGQPAPFYPPYGYPQPYQPPTLQTSHSSQHSLASTPAGSVVNLPVAVDNDMADNKSTSSSVKSGLPPKPSRRMSSQPVLQHHIVQSSGLKHPVRANSQVSMRSSNINLPERSNSYETGTNTEPLRSAAGDHLLQMQPNDIYENDSDSESLSECTMTEHDLELFQNRARERPKMLSKGVQMTIGPGSKEPGHHHRSKKSTVNSLNPLELEVVDSNEEFVTCKLVQEGDLKAARSVTFKVYPVSANAEEVAKELIKMKYLSKGSRSMFLQKLEGIIEKFSKESEAIKGSDDVLADVILTEVPPSGVSIVQPSSEDAPMSNLNNTDDSTAMVIEPGNTTSLSVTVPGTSNGVEMGTVTGSSLSRTPISPGTLNGRTIVPRPSFELIDIEQHRASSVTRNQETGKSKKSSPIPPPIDELNGQASQAATDSGSDSIDAATQTPNMLTPAEEVHFVNCKTTSDILCSGHLPPVEEGVITQPVSQPVEKPADKVLVKPQRRKSIVAEESSAAAIATAVAAAAAVQPEVSQAIPIPGQQSGQVPSAASSLASNYSLTQPIPMHPMPYGYYPPPPMPPAAVPGAPPSAQPSLMNLNGQWCMVYPIPAVMPTYPYMYGGYPQQTPVAPSPLGSITPDRGFVPISGAPPVQQTPYGHHTGSESGQSSMAPSPGPLLRQQITQQSAEYPPTTQPSSSHPNYHRPSLPCITQPLPGISQYSHTSSVAPSPVSQQQSQNQQNQQNQNLASSRTAPNLVQMVPANTSSSSRQQQIMSNHLSLHRNYAAAAAAAAAAHHHHHHHHHQQVFQPHPSLHQQHNSVPYIPNGGIIQQQQQHPQARQQASISSAFSSLANALPQYMSSSSVQQVIPSNPLQVPPQPAAIQSAFNQNPNLVPQNVIPQPAAVATSATATSQQPVHSVLSGQTGTSAQQPQQQQPPQQQQQQQILPSQSNQQLQPPQQQSQVVEKSEKVPKESKERTDRDKDGQQQQQQQQSQQVSQSTAVVSQSQQQQSQTQPQQQTGSSQQPNVVNGSSTTPSTVVSSSSNITSTPLQVSTPSSAATLTNGPSQASLAPASSSSSTVASSSTTPIPPASANANQPSLELTAAGSGNVSKISREDSPKAPMTHSQSVDHGEVIPNVNGKQQTAVARSLKNEDINTLDSLDKALKEKLFPEKPSGRAPDTPAGGSRQSNESIQQQQQQQQQQQPTTSQNGQQLLSTPLNMVHTSNSTGNIEALSSASSATSTITTMSPSVASSSGKVLFELGAKTTTDTTDSLLSVAATSHAASEGCINTKTDSSSSSGTAKKVFRVNQVKDDPLKTAAANSSNATNENQANEENNQQQKQQVEQEGKA